MAPLVVALLPLLWGCARVPDLPTDRLPPCWDSPNCVSTQAPADDPTHHIAPIPRPEGLDLDGVAEVVSGMEGCVLGPRTETTLRAACTTPSGLFTDDLDVLLTPTEVHARSSSRLGYGDMGVNRGRVLALFIALTAD